METRKLIYHDKHNNILQVGDYLQHDSNHICICIIVRFDETFIYPIRVHEDHEDHKDDIFGVSFDRVTLMTKEDVILWKLEN